MVDECMILRRNFHRYRPAIGCEACRVAAAIDLESEDAVVLPARNAMIAIARGAPLTSIFPELLRMPKDTPIRNGKGAHPMITSSALLEGDLGMSMGIAVGHKLSGRPNVLLLISDAKSSRRAAWRNALNFAGLHKLPVLFVLETAMGPRRNFPSSAAFDSPAPPGGLPLIPVLGSDAVAIYRVAREAIHHARKGYGPTLIACQGWPAPPATERAASLGTLPAGAPPRDPLQHMETYLKKHAAWDDDWQRGLIASYSRQIEQAFSSFR